jgi:HEPN domain-containing protein
VTKDEELIHTPSAALEATNEFCTTNSKATLLLHTAAVDYASARCLLINGLVSGGLTMGAQAIEKFLKAYILLRNPAADTKKMRHALSDLLKDADQLSPGLDLCKFSAMMDRFWRYYQHRYPDNSESPTSMTSEEIFELDEFIMFLNENLSLPLEAKYRTGLYALVTFSLHGNTVTPWERWIKQGNRALAPRSPQIEANFRTVLKNLYPRTFG